MKPGCKKYWTQLVQIAEGVDVPEARLHTAECSDCQEALLRLTKTITAGAGEWHKAPQSDISFAKALMRARQRRFSLIRTSLAFSGARRSDPSDFQALYEIDAHQLRVMYSKGEDGWEVTGKAPQADWKLILNGEELPLEDAGRFQFVTKSLEASGFSVKVGEEMIVVPSGLEAASAASSDS